MVSNMEKRDGPVKRKERARRPYSISGAEALPKAPPTVVVNPQRSSRVTMDAPPPNRSTRRALRSEKLHEKIKSNPRDLDGNYIDTNTVEMDSGRGKYIPENEDMGKYVPEGAIKRRNHNDRLERRRKCSRSPKRGLIRVGRDGRMTSKRHKRPYPNNIPGYTESDSLYNAMDPQGKVYITPNNGVNRVCIPVNEDINSYQPENEHKYVLNDRNGRDINIPRERNARDINIPHIGNLSNIPRDMSRSSVLLPAIHSPHHSREVELNQPYYPESPDQYKIHSRPSHINTKRNGRDPSKSISKTPQNTSDKTQLDDFISKLDTRIIACLTSGDRGEVLEELLQLRKSFGNSSAEGPYAKRAKTPLEEPPTPATSIKVTDTAVMQTTVIQPMQQLPQNVPKSLSISTDASMAKSIPISVSRLPPIKEVKMDQLPIMDPRKTLPSVRSEGFMCKTCIDEAARLKAAIDELMNSWVGVFNKYREDIEEGKIDMSSLDLFLLPRLLDEFQPDKYIMVIPSRNFNQKRRQIRSFNSYMALIPVYKNMLLKLADQYKKGDGSDDNRLKIWLEFNRSYRLLLRWFASKYMFLCLNSIPKPPKKVKFTSQNQAKVAIINIRTNSLVSQGDGLTNIMCRFVSLYDKQVTKINGKFSLSSGSAGTDSFSDSFSQLKIDVEQLNVHSIIKNRLSNYCEVLESYVHRKKLKTARTAIKDSVDSGVYLPHKEEVEEVLQTGSDWSLLDWDEMDERWVLLSYLHKKQTIALLNSTRSTLTSMEVELRCMRADNAAKKFEMYNLLARYRFWQRCKDNLNMLVEKGEFDSSYIPGPKFPYVCYYN